MVKLQHDKNTNGFRYHITIPKQFVELVGWKKGTNLTVYPIGEKTLVIKEMPKESQSWKKASYPLLLINFSIGHLEETKNDILEEFWYQAQEVGLHIGKEI